MVRVDGLITNSFFSKNVKVGLFISFSVLVFTGISCDLMVSGVQESSLLFLISYKYFREFQDSCSLLVTSNWNRFWFLVEIFSRIIFPL